MNSALNADVIDRPWLKAYPAGVPADIDASQYSSLVALMEESFKKHRDRVAYSFMGKDITFGQTDSLSLSFGAYLQGLGLARGERVAIMMSTRSIPRASWSTSSRIQAPRPSSLSKTLPAPWTNASSTRP